MRPVTDLKRSVAPIQVNGNLVFNVTPLVTVEGGAIPAGIFDPEGPD